MDFQHSPRATPLLAQLTTFMAEQVLPVEALYREQARSGVVKGRAVVVVGAVAVHPVGESLFEDKRVHRLVSVHGA